MREEIPFVRLARSAFEDALWNEKRARTKFEAWLDLIAEVAYDDHQALWSGKIVKLNRGQTVTSIRHLAERWGWSRRAAMSFLAQIEKDGRIAWSDDGQLANGYRILTLVNYERFNSKRSSDDPTEIQRRSNGDPQQKKGKKGKNITTPYGVVPPQLELAGHPQAQVNTPPPRKQSSQEEFAAWFQEERAKKYPTAEPDRPAAQKINARLKQPLLDVGVAELKRRALVYLAKRDDYLERAGYPLMLFVTQHAQHKDGRNGTNRQDTRATEPDQYTALYDTWRAPTGGDEVPGVRTPDDPDLREGQSGDVPAMPVLLGSG